MTGITCFGSLKTEGFDYSYGHLSGVTQTNRACKDRACEDYDMNEPLAQGIGYVFRS